MQSRFTDALKFHNQLFRWKDKVHVGVPRIVVPTDHIACLLEIGLPVTTISNLLGVSRATLYRRMAENNLSVRGLYSTCTDAELDGLVFQVKERMPHAG